jgi:hypothetical protein
LPLMVPPPMPSDFILGTNSNGKSARSQYSANTKRQLCGKASIALQPKRMQNEAVDCLAKHLQSIHFLQYDAVSCSPLKCSYCTHERACLLLAGSQAASRPVHYNCASTLH